MKLRLGFIGIGAMGLSHLKGFHEGCSKFAEAMAVCGRDPANLKKALAVAPNARAFEKETDLIASDVDAVVVSTPNFTHVPLALEILRAGKHLFLEKPCGVTADQGHQLLGAAAGSKKVVLIGHELRYSAYFQRIHQLVHAGEIGTPRMVWTREFRGPFQRKSQDWIHDARKSGGTLVDKSCHHFDLMNWWAGARPKRVAAFGGCAMPAQQSAPVHDHASVSWEYDSGARGTLQLCMFAREFPEEDLEMGIIGDAGMLQTRIATLDILHWRPSSSEPLVHHVPAKAGQGWGGHLGFSEIHDAFIQGVLNGQPALTTPRDCVDGTLLAIAAEESIRQGNIVPVAQLQP